MRTPEEIRRRNRRLDIGGYTLLFFDALVAAFNAWFGQWFFVVLLVIVFVVTWRMIAWRHRVIGGWDII